MAPISCSVCAIYPKSVILFLLIKFLMDLCMAIYDDIVDAIMITDEKLVHFTLSKSGQILHIGKTSFPLPSHTYVCICACMSMSVCMCEYLYACVYIIMCV